MNAHPLVSVIIPSFNHAAYIGNAIDSVLAQTYENWELIIVDDGSSDDTATVLESYRDRPGISIIINSMNKGQSAVVNQALRLARGEFVCFLPSDDWYLPSKLRLQVSKFQELDASYGAVYGRGQRFFEDTGQTVDAEAPKYSGWVLAQLVERNFVYPITPLFRKGCFEKYPFDETYRAEGEAIYLKLAISYKFSYVDDYVGVMRDHSRNTGKDVSMMLADNLRYWEEFFAREDLPSDIRQMKGWRLGRLLRLKGMEFVNLIGMPNEGRRLLLRGISMSPKQAFDLRVLATLMLSFLPVSWVARLGRLRRGRNRHA